MKIRKIKTIKNYKSFSDFSWGQFCKDSANSEKTLSNYSVIFGENDQENRQFAIFLKAFLKYKIFKILRLILQK